MNRFISGSKQIKSLNIF